MYDLKGGKIPHTYLISVLLEEGMIMAFSSTFYFSKLFFSLLPLHSLFSTRLKYRSGSSPELMLEDFTIEAYGSFHMEIMMPIEILGVWLGIQKLHLCRMCIAV